MTRLGVLVVAKAPVPGVAKTRLARVVGPQIAADLAAAALLDTLQACEDAFPPDARVVALRGALGRAARGTEIAGRLRTWYVIGQRGDDFPTRLVAAHADAAVAVGGPVLQVGMDTPQVDAADLTGMGESLRAGTHDAVLAPADDGGWWALGVRRPRLARCLQGVPMSTAHTGRDTCNVLRRSGAEVWIGPSRRDVDEAGDAAAVAASAPHTRFAHAWIHTGRPAGAEAAR